MFRTHSHYKYITHLHSQCPYNTHMTVTKYPINTLKWSCCGCVFSSDQWVCEASASRQDQRPHHLPPPKSDAHHDGQGESATKHDRQPPPRVQQGKENTHYIHTPPPPKITISINLYLLLLIPLYQSLSIFINLYQSLSIFINLYNSLSIFINLYQSLSIFINLYHTLPWREGELRMWRGQVFCTWD